MPDIIQVNSQVLNGQPVVKDTRVPVARILALIGMGYTLSMLKKELPVLKKLTRKDISDMLSYYRDKFSNRQEKISKI